MTREDFLYKIANLSNFKKGWQDWKNSRKKSILIYNIILITFCILSIFSAIYFQGKQDIGYIEINIALQLLFSLFFLFDLVSNIIYYVLKNKNKKYCWIKVWFSPIIIIILISTVPNLILSLISLSDSHIYKGSDWINSLRFFRILYIMKYLDVSVIFFKVFKREFKLLIGWILFLLLFILAFACTMYLASPADNDFLKSLYYSVITITTIGFGDVHPIGNVEKILTMFFGFVGGLLYTSFGALIITSVLKNINETKNKKDVLDTNVKREINQKKLDNHE